ncbi:MAG: hypothetical protein SGILL_005654 [Bacillariaceae sp.]
MSDPSAAPPPSDNETHNLSLQSAMHAADAIRKSLRDNLGDDNEGGLPPGSVPGVLAFVGTGLLLTPLRSALLRRVAANGAPKVATSNIPSPSSAARTEAATAAESSKKSDLNAQVNQQQGLASFQNLVDLMVTPLLAVMAAQVGLVVGTLYGSSYYLERVVEMEERNGGDGGSNTDAICQSLLSAISSTDDNQGHGQSSDTAIGHADVSDMSSISTDGILQTSTSASPPQMFEAWDPRQQTIDRLYHAIRHCQETERRKNNPQQF